VELPNAQRNQYYRPNFCKKEKALLYGPKVRRSDKPAQSADSGETYGKGEERSCLLIGC
jgi:hypothetical protein